MGLIDITKTITLEHPTEEGVTVTVRPLRGIEMDEANEHKVKRTIEVWGSSLDAISKIEAVNREQTDTLQSRMQKYDATTLLGYAIVAWSYSETVTPEDIANLDSATRGWLHEEVVTRNTRPLPRSTSGVASSSLEGSPSN